MAGHDPSRDFSSVAGGCLVTSHEFGKVRTCRTFCANGGDDHRRTEGCRFFSNYTAVPQDGAPSFVELLHVPTESDWMPCDTTPVIPAGAPRVGALVPCWRSNLSPTPGFYSCLCSGYFGECPSIAGSCTKLTDPEAIWDFVEQEMQPSLILFGVFVGVPGICWLCGLIYLPYHCWFKRAAAVAAAQDDVPRVSVKVDAPE
ncbi:unnamed protein product [Symbiodinium microadriaticum]|nr:unnamed protein product [Symbiodinium microadriaticum]CAE7758541.1 unnamed protein product [Symbiodinium sp. KB8]